MPRAITTYLLAFLTLLVLPAVAGAEVRLVLPALDQASADRPMLLAFDPASGAFTSIVRRDNLTTALRDPVWSPDGAALVHVRQHLPVAEDDPDGGATVVRRDELWLGDGVKANQRKLLASGAIGPPAFSPNGKLLAFMSRHAKGSGRGCRSGGIAVTLVILRTRESRRLSRCSNKLRAGGRAVFFGGNRRVAFAEGRSLAEVQVDGLDAGDSRLNRLVSFKDRATHVLQGRAGRYGLWASNALGDNLIFNWSAQTTRRISDFDLAVAPDGHTAVGACGELAQSGICARKIPGGTSTRIASPFTADVSRDNLEFGYGFDPSSKQLATFAFAGSGGPADATRQSLCLRATLAASAPTCTPLPPGIRVIERGTAIATWRP